MYAQAIARPLVRTADLVVRVSATLDAAAGAAPDHAIRTCLLVMRLAEALGISDRDRSSLFYAALLHEAGSGRVVDGEIGAHMIGRAGFPPEVAGGVMALHERWDGRGAPYSLSGEAIPLFGRLLSVCHGLDDAAARGGTQHAMQTIHARSGSWYDPALTDVLLALCSHGLATEMVDPERYGSIRDLEPNWLARMADADEAGRINAVTASGGDARA